MEPVNINLGDFSCPNGQCELYGLKQQGNIGVRGSYGKDKNRTLLYCRACGKRFAPTTGTPLYGASLSTETIQGIIHHAAEGVGVRATARLMNLDKDTVNDVILRIGTYFAQTLDRMLRSLAPVEIQLDELWAYGKFYKMWRDKKKVVNKR
jgi:transposase-like protein